MKNIVILSSIILITALATFVFSMWLFDTTEEPEGFKKHIISSKILKEDREIVIRLPDSYDITKKYPTVYVIGGNSLTFNILDDINILSRTGYFKESIVIGIPNVDNTSRQRDFTPPGMKQDLDEKNSPEGRADTYLSFIEKEIIPFVEKTYTTDTTRIIVGHSRAGMTVLYSLIQTPDLFAGRICLSPALWREDMVFVNMVKEYLSYHTLPKSYLFLSMGSDEVEKMKLAFDEMNNVLENIDHPALEWKYYYTPGANHNNNSKLSAAIGLKEILRSE